MVVAAPGVIVDGRALTDLFDPARLEEAFNRGVERARRESDFTVSSLRYVLDDGVPVEVVIDERQKDLEDLCGERRARSIVGHCNSAADLCHRTLYRLTV